MGYYLFMDLPEGKREALNRAAKFFDLVPFADFGVLSGSCAMGNARTDSDIDIIVGCRSGRVWTARFFTLLFSDFTGIRHKGGISKDKLCLSLFISEGGYRMNDPENDYERRLYPELKPLFGKGLDFFYKENRGLVSDDFMSRKDLQVASEKLPFVGVMERILGGAFGDRIEKRLRGIQYEKIKRHIGSLSGEGKMRIVLSGDRVETHFRVN